MSGNRAVAERNTPEISIAVTAERTRGTRPIGGGTVAVRTTVQVRPTDASAGARYCAGRLQAAAVPAPVEVVVVKASGRTGGRCGCQLLSVEGTVAVGIGSRYAGVEIAFTEAGRRRGCGGEGGVVPGGIVAAIAGEAKGIEEKSAVVRTRCQQQKQNREFKRA